MILAAAAVLWIRAHAQTDKPFAKEVAAFKQKDAVNPPEKGQILFIGSSSFTRWQDVGDYFPGYKILNRAFGGSMLPNVIEYADDIIFPYEPKQIVIYCGENDFVAKPEPIVGQVVKRFEALFKLIRRRMPDVPIAYISMKPSPSRWALRDKFAQANDFIAGFLKHHKNAAYIDVWPVMLNDQGVPKPEIFVGDKLHMNADGYKLWKPVIEPYLVK